jgi:hypothetical protein
MNEATERAEALRGQAAAQVLDNPAFKDAMAGLRAEIIETWKACPIRDTEGQRLLLQLAKLCDKFEATLVGRVHGGKLAESKLDVDDLRNDSTTRRLLRKVL